MNVFGSFSFGRIITTLLPGYLIFLSFLIISFLWLRYFEIELYCSSLFETKQQLIALLTISILFSLFLGLLLNTLFFAYFKTKIIHEKQPPKYLKYIKPSKVKEAFGKLHNDIDKVEEYIEKIEELVKKTFLHNAEIKFKNRDIDISSEEEIDISSKEEIEPSAIMLQAADLEKVVYGKENFWSYCEFQSNAFVASILTFFSLDCYFLYFAYSHSASNRIFCILVFPVVIAIQLSILLALIYAAKRNYYYHRKYHISLLFSSYVDSLGRQKGDEMRT